MMEFDVKALSRAAADLAESWLTRANALRDRDEIAFHRQMAGLFKHPSDKATLTQLIDQSFRSGVNARVADQVTYLLQRRRIPAFFTRWEKHLMRLFLLFGRLLPGLSVPAMIHQMRHFSRRAILPGEPGPLMRQLRKRRAQGVRMNINHLGEALLGEGEAANRMETYLRHLRNPAIECISIKISTIYSQIHALAFDHTVSVLADRLSVIYQAAKENAFVRENGEKVPKFVYLDMEAYGDLEITTTAFMLALERDGLQNVQAGIALQAYLPDTHPIQKKLTEWAVERVRRGGSPIKIRIVKGANLQMERVTSERFNWPLATYDNKPDVDANYKRMVLYGMQPEHISAVHLGIASHNLFELAFSQQAAAAAGVTNFVAFEMLEGMADHIRRAIREQSMDIVMYAPVAEKNQFINAIAYLIRRLDENTTPENFLRHAADLKTGTGAWHTLKNRFFDACDRIEQPSTTSRRVQNRNAETVPAETGTFYDNEFVNEADTDWSLPANRSWAEGIREKWKKKAGDGPMDIPLVVAGREIFENREIGECFDPSQYREKIRVARFRRGNLQDVAAAVDTARSDPDGWRATPFAQRHKTLSRVAAALRTGRGDLIGAAAADTGKVFTESDVEVSEAVDFAEYYPLTVKHVLASETIEGSGKGVGLVVSPWNFPIAIPCGGIVAALASGNTVIFKPASDAVLTAWVLCRYFWDAGVPRTALQFLPCRGSREGARLAEHPGVDFVVLTGGTDTAMEMLARRPGLFLAAETGGKNATIVTAMADRDQSIKNVVDSAFGNAGQKCSATSLLILEKEVYHSPDFKRQLVDAAASFKVGSAWRFENKMGPLIRPPSGNLEKAMTVLEPGETWALKPRRCDGNPHLWSPGIKWGTRPGSFTHTTEFFGPVLAVMRAENLDRAIDLANGTGYGLTSGLESLDEREHQRWKKRIEAGNLYINRGTTGAITLRQPFGGMKKSAVGPGIKAGSPNTVTQFMRFRDVALPVRGPLEKENRWVRLSAEWRQKVRWNAFGRQNREMAKVVRAMESYLFHMETEFGRDRDYFNLRGQDNIFRYLPLGTIGVRLHERDSLLDVLARILAVKITGNGLVISAPRGLDGEAMAFLDGEEGKRLLGNAAIRFQSDEEVAGSLEKLARLRYAAADRVPECVFAAAARTGFFIACAPVLMEGRLELLHYLRNQSICHTYHRYGNLGDRALT